LWTRGTKVVCNNIDIVSLSIESLLENTRHLLFFLLRNKYNFTPTHIFSNKTGDDWCLMIQQDNKMPFYKNFGANKINQLFVIVCTKIQVIYEWFVC
jgi:hypothetical protein